MPNLFKDVEDSIAAKNSLLYIEQKINSAVLKIYTKNKKWWKNNVVWQWKDQLQMPNI